MPNDATHMLRHMLATLAYRGSKAIRNAPPGFGDFRAPSTLNTPVMLLAHIGDLIDWAHRWTQGGTPKFETTKPLGWDAEVQRFHSLLEAFDAFLQQNPTADVPLETLFQAPIADALTHIGQIALLRRMMGDPVAGEAYRVADIVPGRVGPEQTPPKREFERDGGAIYREPPLPPKP